MKSFLYEKEKIYGVTSFNKGTLSGGYEFLKVRSKATNQNFC